MDEAGLAFKDENLAGDRASWVEVVSEFEPGDREGPAEKGG